MNEECIVEPVGIVPSEHPSPSQAERAVEAPSSEADERTASERTSELFARMHTRRKTLLGILAFCREARTVDAVEQEVARLEAHDASVYSAAAYCDMLMRAGALECVGATEDAEPETVIVDGVACLKPTEGEPLQWLSTQAGLSMVDANDPASRLRELLRRDAFYAPIYLKVLTMCEDGGGASAKELDRALIKDPLLQEPRYFAAHFVDLLAGCDALVFTGSWEATDLGKRAIPLLQAQANAAGAEENQAEAER